MANLHDDIVIFDGLIVANFGAEVFQAMRMGGVTAANCTCSVWENFQDTMNNIARWKQWFHEHDDLILPAHCTADVRRAKEMGRTGIVLGFQNVSAYEDQIGYVQLFKDLGVGIVQMAYNTQNLICTGCYEEVDNGLSDFGREIVAEMNRAGVMCDLSHVGATSARDVIDASTKPVCYSHCLPLGLKDHPRNKSDEDLRFIADRGGFIGVTMVPAFLKRGAAATVDDFVEAIDYVIDIVGEDCVGIGTDFADGHDQSFFDWIALDKGYARRLTDFGNLPSAPEGMRTIGQFPNLTATIEKAGWGEAKIRKVMGENWLRVLAEVWGE